MSEQINLPDRLILPIRPPLKLLAIGFLAIAMAVILSTRFFPDLGPSAAKLNSENDSIRRVAEVTTLDKFLLKGFC